MLYNVCVGKVNKPSDLLHQVSVYPFPFMLIDSRLLLLRPDVVHFSTSTLVVFLLVPSDSFSIIKCSRCTFWLYSFFMLNITR